MKTARTIMTLVIALIAATRLSASGPLGIYAVIEKVVFEPNEATAERIQVWGAFAFVDERATPGNTVSPIARGYLYFTLPPSIAAIEASVLRGNPHLLEAPETIRREWADLKAVAGTGQAVGFGSWAYIGSIGRLRPDAPRGTGIPYILGNTPGNPPTDLRVRPATETPATPATYQTNTGVVKVSDTANRPGLVKELRDALK